MSGLRPHLSQNSEELVLTPRNEGENNAHPSAQGWEDDASAENDETCVHDNSLYIHDEGEQTFNVSASPLNDSYKEIGSMVFLDDKGELQSYPSFEAYNNHRVISVSEGQDVFMEEQHQVKAVENSPPRTMTVSFQEVQQEKILCKACQGTHTSHTCGRGRSGHHKRSASSSPPPIKTDSDAECWAPKSRTIQIYGGGNVNLSRVKVTIIPPKGPPTPPPQPKKEMACTYEHCPNPHHTSSNWKTVSSDTRAGGRDWSCYVGRLFCNACFTQYATTGSMVRKVRTGARDTAQQENAEDMSAACTPNWRREGKGEGVGDSGAKHTRTHAGGMALRPSDQCSLNKKGHLG